LFEIYGNVTARTNKLAKRQFCCCWILTRIFVYWLAKGLTATFLRRAKVNFQVSCKFLENAFAGIHVKLKHLTVIAYSGICSCKMFIAPEKKLEGLHICLIYNHCVFFIVIKVNVTIYVPVSPFSLHRILFLGYGAITYTSRKNCWDLEGRKKTIPANKTRACLRKCIWGAEYIIAGLASIGSYRWINAPFLQGFAHKCWVDHWVEFCTEQYTHKIYLHSFPFQNICNAFCNGVILTQDNWIDLFLYNISEGPVHTLNYTWST
jgi:hypothetical protein